VAVISESDWVKAVNEQCFVLLHAMQTLAEGAPGVAKGGEVRTQAWCCKAKGECVMVCRQVGAEKEGSARLSVRDHPKLCALD